LPGASSFRRVIQLLRAPDESRVRDTLTRTRHLLDDEEHRVGSMPLTADAGRVILENTRTAAPSGAEKAVREGSTWKVRAPSVQVDWRV
jgi:hypothetical protein